MNQSTSDASSIQFNLPPLSLSLFDAEPSTHDQPNGVVHGSIPKHSSEPSTPTSSGYVAERGSSSTATSISHEIEELNIHDPPPSVSNDSDASLLPSQGNIEE
ncbi:vacuolar fusion MON1-like protein, partial [Trifolium pratense]